MPKTFTKDPEAVLDYTIDWTDWLIDSDTIIASTWTVPVGITKNSDAISENESLTTIWLSNGIVGTNYSLVNHITTSEGRQDDRTIIIRIREK